MRDHVSTLASLTHVAIVKSPVTELTMPLGRLACPPPLSASALPLAPPAAKVAPVADKVAVRVCPELSNAKLPELSLNLYQATSCETATTVMPADPEAVPLLARTTADAAPAGA